MKNSHKAVSVLSVDLAAILSIKAVLGVRIIFASAMMLWFIVVSVSASRAHNVLEVTEKCIAPVWLFVLAMMPEVIRESRAFIRNRFILLPVIALSVCCASWFFQDYSRFEPRLQFTAGVVLLFPAAVGWFRIAGDKGMQLAILIKITVLAFACYLIGSDIISGVSSREIFLHPPIYRHLRHFNYDLAIVAAMIGGLMLPRFRYFKWLIVLSFFVLGYFSFWSGGRGQVVALLVVVVSLSLGVTRERLHELSFPIQAISAFLFGALLVVLTGQTDLAFGALDRSSREGLNAVSSGRLAIWMGTLSTSSETVVGALFGHGPESFVRLAVFKQFNHYITHPHNTVIQWVFEYGVVGAAAVMTIYFNLAKRCVWPALFSANKLERLSSAAVIGMTVFSLFDGIYYHAAPLLFMTLIWAYLCSRSSREALAHSTDAVAD